MKKTLRTILYSFLAVGLFGFSASTVFAATVFNNHASDYATVRVTNQTQNPNSSTSWSSSTTANAGDTIAVIVYYHNNGSENAVSTKLKINNGTFLSSASTHVISGSVGASNAPTVSGSATVNLTSSQTLTFVSGSPAWFANNQGTILYTLPNGQDGSEIFTGSGLNIGTIVPGWSQQGTFVFHYKVSDNQVENQAPIVTTNSYSLNSNNTQATLNGYVNGQGQNPYTWFVYGTSSSLGNGSNSTSQTYQNSTSTNFSDVIYGLNDNTTYYYKACALTNNGGTVCGATLSFTTDDNDDDYCDYNYCGDEDEDIEVSTLSAQNVDENEATLRGDIIETNNEDVVRYFEWGTNSNNLNQTTYLSGQTDNTGQFSKTIYGLNDNTTYYFRACIDSQDSSQNDCGSVKSFKTQKDQVFVDDSCGTAMASTTYATGISGTSAVLNGVSIAGNSSTNSYFQYGTTTALGSSVGSQTVSSCGTLYNSYNLTGLQSNKTYYYRIATGNTYGQIKSFTTGNVATTVIVSNTTNTNTNTTTTSTNTNTGGGSGIIYLALDITPDFENVSVGDVVNFTVDYRNLYNGTLEDVIIQVMFPEEIEYVKSTQGFYSVQDRALIVDLGDLEDDEKGSFLVQAEVFGRFNNQDVVVTIAEGTYDHPTIENAQGSSTAYALNTILLNRSTLGAFAFGAGFFPGIFGWLFLLLILLLIVWVSRKIYNDHQDRKAVKPTLNIN